MSQELFPPESPERRLLDPSHTLPLVFLVPYISDLYEGKVEPYHVKNAAGERILNMAMG